VAGWQACAEDAHWRGAVRTADGRAPRWRGRRELDREQALHAREQALAPGVQDSVLACPVKALGQDVLEEQPEEVGAGQGADLALAGLALGVSEAHLAIAAGEDVALAEHAAVEVASEVLERLLAPADVEAIDIWISRRSTPASSRCVA